MLKALGVLGLGILGGAAAMLWWPLERGPVRVPASALPAATPVDLGGRLKAVEAALAQERAQREELEGTVRRLEALLAAAPAALPPGSSAPRRPGARVGDAAPADAPPIDAPPDARFGQRGPARLDEADLVQRFVAAGIAGDRAQWIVQRTEELRMQALQAQYDAAREGTPFDPRAVTMPSTLRDELGDNDYERYLQAMGRPTTIAVREVLASSPGERAGFEPGDEIVSYGGERVFDIGDLNRAVLDGESGQLVAVDVLRSGQPVQLFVPRGPIGITGGGRFGRPR
jgi:PDZ domain